MNLNPYLKSIVGAVVAGLGAAEAAVNASPTHSIDLSSGIVVAITTLTALGGVYATSNSGTLQASAISATVETTNPAPLPALPPLPADPAPAAPVAAENTPTP